MNRSVIQTLDLLEGKKWDKVKKHLRKHKGKYLLGAGAYGVARLSTFISRQREKNKYNFFNTDVEEMYG